MSRRPTGFKLLPFLAACFLLAAGSLLAACTLAPGGNPTPEGTAGTGTPSGSTTATATAGTPGPVASGVPLTVAPGTQPAATQLPAGPVTLRVWVPPQFDPLGGSEAGELLRERLEAFSRRRPGVSVEVRVKAVEGPGGLLDALSTASTAAPLAVPDLVALPRGEMEAAALKGMLYPFDTLSGSMDDPDWYEYAVALSQIQNNTFGLPFAGDALLLVSRPAVVPTPPATWEQVLAASGPMVFPAADSEALFTLAMYQAAGGSLRDEQGRPVLDPAALTEVLAFYANAGQGGLMPFWLTQYATDEQAWAAMIENRANLAITTASRYLSSRPADTTASPLPTPGGDPFTLATGWVWALSARQPQRQELAVQLADYLVESSFLTKWSEASGYLPTRPSALAGWSDNSLQMKVETVVASAQLAPSEDVLISLGPALQNAVVRVLKGEAEPETAAQEAAAPLATP